MDNKYIVILLTALLVAMAPSSAVAIYTNYTSNGLLHNPSTNYVVTCDKCHNTANPILGKTGYINACVSCHSGGNAGSSKPFTVNDAANPYGTSPARSGVVYQTSHNWNGSLGNPMAGARVPQNRAMQNANISGVLLCVTCHNVHGQYSSASQSKPFLRVRNDNDAMCRDCHATRDKNSHIYGTHPININYSTSRVNNPGMFFRSVSSNSSNPSNSSNKMTLVNGNLQCTTCHGLHYTDSRSGTTHNAASQANLSTSSGYLLKTNVRGNNPDDINICTNCHAGKMAHNGVNQNIQCVDCHAGHVEYDPLSVTSADKLLVNQFLIRRYMNISTAYGAIRNSRTFFRYTGAQAEFYVFTADRSVDPTVPVGICQTCHNDTQNFVAFHYVDPSDRSKGINPALTNCTLCHNHSAGSFGCGSCHGNPPRHNKRGGGPFTNGYAYWSSGTTRTINYAKSASFLNESSTPHSSHADTDGRRYLISCYQCHHGNEKTHSSGNFQQVFLRHSTVAGSSAQYNTSTQTCTNVYCHSNAQSSPIYQTVSWKNTKNTIMKGNGVIRCQACHGDKNSITSSSTALSGNHQRHAATSMANYACQTCHDATLARYPYDNNTGLIYPAQNHVNGIKDVKFYSQNNNLNTYLTSGTYDNNAKICSNVYCHSNGKGALSKVSPTWGNTSTGQCGSCHGVLGPNTSTTFGMITSAAHFRHLSSTSYGPKLSSYTAPTACMKCHTRFVNEMTHVVGAQADQLADYTAGNPCYKCHGGAQQGAFTPQGGLGSLNWANKTTRIACTQCHPINANYSASRLPDGNSAPKQSNYSTSGHGKSIKPFSKLIVCTNCHDQNSSHINTNPANAGVNKRLLPFNNYTGKRSKSNTLCNSCHWPGQSAQNRVMFSHVTSVTEAANNTPTMPCITCHNVHGSPSDHMVNNNIVFNPMSSPYFIPYSSPYFIVYSSPNSTVVRSMTTKTGRAFKFIQTSPPYRGFCQVCHTKTMHFKRGRDEASLGPNSGQINTNVPGNTTKIISHKGMNAYTNCLSCHAHNPPPQSTGQYAFYPFGRCDACHGYPPVPKSWRPAHNNYSSARFEDYTGAGGSHVYQGHIDKAADPAQGWDLCTNCHHEDDHLTVSSFYQVKVRGVNDNRKFNANVQAKYTSNRLDGVNHITGTCYNVSCHFQRTPKWGTP